ncbi:unnamed protein product [Malus baccata var. baccata]
MRYKRSLKKSGRNKTTRPKGDLDPSGVIGSIRRHSSDELRAFEDLGIVSEHVDEFYLAAFLACWLCKFVFPTDKSRPSSSTAAKLEPLMTKYSGVFSTKSLDDLQAQALFESCEDLRMNPLVRVGSVRQGIVDNSHFRFSDLSYLISLRSGQFGFVQNVPGKLKEKNQSASLQAVYMHWESCTRACTNVVITLLAKNEFKSNPMTRVYARWWSKVYYKNLGMASGTNFSHSGNDMSREGCPVVLMQVVALDCTSAAPLQDRPIAFAPQCPCLSPRHPDTSEEAGIEVDSHEDGFILQQRQQVSNKRPLEDAQVDSDVNFRHKKKEVFRPPQFDGRVAFGRDVGPSCPFDLATPDVCSYMKMLFAGDLPTDREIGDPPGAELVLNPSNFPSLPCVGRGMQEPVMRPTPLPASSEISLRGSNLSGTERLIHRISLGTAIEIKSHIEERISKCPLEDLMLLKEDLSKLVSVIDNLNVDSSSLKIKIAELMAASTEYSSLRAISLEKLSPNVRAYQLATINLSLAQVRSSQQAASGDYQVTETSLTSIQVRLDALVRER